jgi:hypothetical protein
MRHMHKQARHFKLEFEPYIVHRRFMNEGFWACRICGYIDIEC